MPIDAAPGGEDVNDVADWGPWELGVNNRVPDFAVGPKELRDAVNVDIWTSGHLRRRTGTTRRVTSEVHSLCSNGTLAYAVVNNDLHRIKDDGTVGAAIAVGMGPRRVCYYEHNGTVYWTNGTRNGRIRSDTPLRWGMPTPSSNLVAGALSSGGLDVGDYQYAITWINALGEESGASRAGLVLGVPAGGGFLLSGFPSPPPDATLIRVYVSSAFGSTLYRYTDVPVGTGSVIVGLSAFLGKQLTTQFLKPMPIGEELEFFNGRAFVSIDNVLFWSEPLNYLLYNPTRNFLIFEEPITLIAAAVEGIAVVADAHYFLAGRDITAAQLIKRLPFKGVRGTLAHMPQSRSRIGQGNTNKLASSRDSGSVWRCDRGLVIMDNGGDMRVITEDQILMREATLGATLVREADGMRHIISSVSDASDKYDSAVSQDFIASTQIER